MANKRILKRILSLSLILCLGLSASKEASAKIAPIILLSDYYKELNIGEQYCLFAFSSDGRAPKYRSSDKKIASVDAYGNVRAKRAGECDIYASAYTSESICRIKVNKTRITLGADEISIERNEIFELKADTSNGSIPKFKSSRPSVASVDDEGRIVGAKPGEAVITVKADSSSAICKVTVKQPAIKLDRLYKRLYRCQSFKLNATVSSGAAPIWKSNKKSVATVDPNGTVRAIKHGTALISANVDGVSKTCEVVVMPPEITLSDYSLTIPVGTRSVIEAKISSGNAPVWKSSNPKALDVDQTGNIYAKKAGSATVSVKEDGTCVKCKIKIVKNL